MKSFFKKNVLFLKKVARPQVWKVLNFYDRKFTQKGKKAEKFDKLMRENQIYFTTDVNTEGFTDQLARLVFFYKVGSSLGMKYYYTPLNSQRSSETFLADDESKKDNYSDIYDFLGVNEYLEKISAKISSGNFENVVIDLDDINFTRRDRESFSHLIFVLKSILADKIPDSRNVLIHFRSSPKAFLLFQLTVPVTKHHLNFRKIYFQKREKNPHSSKFSEDKIKLLVHIRQGDTAIIKTPWKSYIPVWYKMKNKLREVHDRAEMDDFEVIDVDEYYIFLKRLFEYMDSNYFSTVVYSDGFKYALRIIEEQKIFTELSQNQKKEWNEYKLTYNQAEFEKFYNWNGINVEVGEENEKLYDLVQSFFDAEMIIFGTQAKLIPKLLSIYSNSENMPLIINLYHEEPPHIEYLGIDHSWPGVLFVDLNNFEMEEIADQIQQYFAAKNRCPWLSKSG